MSDAFVCDKLSNSMETVRNDFAMEMETDGGGMVGIQAARGNSVAPTNPFSLRNFGTELRSVSVDDTPPPRESRSDRHNPFVLCVP